MLVVKVQFLCYTSSLLLNWTKRQTDANSDCPEHNEADINRPVCIQVGILIAFQKLQRWYVRGVNMTQFSCCLYTQG